MKKILLSIFAVLFAFAGVQAQEVTTKYTFSSYTAGTQYAQGEEHALDSDVTLIINGAHLNTQVRLYDGSNAVLKVNGSVSTLVAKAGYKAATLTIYGSNDGETWTKIGTVSTTTSYKEYTFTIGGYSQVKMESTDAQIRVSEATLTYTKSGVTKAVAPTVVGGEFVGSTTVTITNNSEAEGATVYYTVNGVEIEPFTGASKEFTIVENTTIVAYAQIGNNEETRSATVTAEFTRVAADPVLDYDATSFDNEIIVSVTSDDDVYYTLDGTEPNAESTPFETALTLKATATLKVVAIDADGYASAVKEQKFTKNESASGAGETTLVTDASTLAIGDQIVIVASDYNYALSTTQNGNNRGQAAVTKDGNNITYGADVQIITLEDGSVDGTFAFNVGTGYLYAASSGSNYLRTKETLDNNGSWTVSVTDGIASIIAQGSNTRNMMQYNQTSSIFSCYASDKPQKDISIYKINKASIEAYTLTVGNAGWATLFLGHNAVIPEDVTCYVIPEVTESTVELVEITTGVIPASTAVIVKADAGEYAFEVADKADAVETKMAGTTVNTYITKEAYVLGIVDGVVGLYKAEMAGGVWLNNANKAYLPASEVPNKSAAFYGFDWNGTTGIDEITDNREQSTAIYDLTGRRVEAITAPGIYIVNGKKTLVK